MLGLGLGFGLGLGLGLGLADPSLYWQQLAHAPDSSPDVVALHLAMLGVG